MSWKFWKKNNEEDELAAFERELGISKGDETLGIDTSKPIEESYNKLGEEKLVSEQTRLDQQRDQPRQLQQFSQNTDIQLVSAKLDTVKAMLDVVNQRLDNIEKEIHEKQKQKMW